MFDATCYSCSYLPTMQCFSALAIEEPSVETIKAIDMLYKIYMYIKK